MADKNDKPGLFGSIKRSLSRRGPNARSTPSPTSPTQTGGYLAPQSGFSAPQSGYLASQSSYPAPQSNNPFTSGSPPTRRPSNSNWNPFKNTPLEEPPPYTPSTDYVSPTDAGDDEYEFLRTFDTIFLIDDSGSMRTGSRWYETGQAIEQITPICTSKDADGIDIYFLNERDSPHYRNVKSAGTVVEIFQNVRPYGATPTGRRLNDIIEPYLKKLKKNPSLKPINIIVITDGQPSDCLDDVIIETALKLDKYKAKKHQIGIQFFQVGDDAAARKHLKELDDDLEALAGRKIRDIVDTVPFSGQHGESLSANGILKVVLGSVNRRHDRNSCDLHRRQ